MRSSTVFDCFCGFGGLSIGAELAGLNVVGGVDANLTAVGVFAECFPKAHALHGDLLTTDPRRMLKSAGISRGDVDILVGGPPCQPYSINNHQRGIHDSRCELVERYLEFVSTLRPNWLVMENVPAFASIEGGAFLTKLIRSLRGRGYSTAFDIFDATNFGVPQKRRRLVIVASRDGSKLLPAMEDLAARRDKIVTVGEALGDLPESTSALSTYIKTPAGSFQKTMRRHAPSSPQAHVSPQLGEKNLNRIRHVPAGGNWRDIPRALLPPGMMRAKLSDHTTRYGRLQITKPSFTLLTKCDPHWGCFVHPTQDRIISVREAARLQSIPDRVQFTGNLSSSYKLIGNAVPPLLAKGILEIIR